MRGRSGSKDTTTARLPREIWVLVGAAFVIAVGFGVVAPALPTFARSFDVGVTAASLVISLFAVFRLGFAPVSGRLVSRFGELRVYVVGLGISAASSALCAFAANYWQLLFFRAFGGIGSTMFTVSAISLLVRLAPPEARGRASGSWATGFLLGNVAGPLLGGLLIGFGLRVPFLAYSGTVVVALVLTGVLLRGRTGPPVSADPAAAPAATFHTAFGHPTYRAALAASFANGWAVFGVRVAMVPLFVVMVLQESDAWSGYALGVFAVGNAATLMISGRWSDRSGRKPPVMSGLVVAAVATGVLGLVESLPVFLVLSLVCGVGSGLVNPAMTAAVADVIGAKSRGGTVLAGFQMAGDLGAITGPLVAGFVAEHAGFGWAFGVTGVISALALLFWLRAPETLPAGGAVAADDSIPDCVAAEAGPTALTTSPEMSPVGVPVAEREPRDER
ncbi:MAG: MFS transporter [Pseudonocardia sp.]|uniref:MFS transporter n=1 Tax=unclassified Pseudonocardia TaxID=2619320 RepID=UPI000869B6D1|nr:MULTISPECIES: MFS transporter [unclassified Pseudonocardia]MBN9109438.1 MFS transporter [Pseudonocardia sp.]ODU29976.1 MAG: MFS transporter permease [Pseudonocardia sp. SCN 72-51]ODV08229.1 MAG: MFS transporter permease [Pseudonocardia sp. SCN 73-27]